ncbi:MAG: efflux RND transporter periplasmic adaptor subunit [Gammaproteobacteria bacterium]|nr:efflux RND transporter periplasmic adaptor subunit [Gammaproteobacteria bacterium]
MNFIIKILAPIIMIAAGTAVAVMLDMNKPEAEKKDVVSHAPSILVDKVKRQDMRLMISTQAEVKANIEVELISQLSGMVKAISPEFIEGGRFNSGETLLWIDDADYKLALKRVQARLAEADVRVKQAKADAQVARHQLKNAKNPSALALKEPQLAEAIANLKAVQADIALAQLNLSRTKVSLPFKGRMKSIRANVGQYVSTGSSLGRGFATDKVKLRLAITDQQLAHLNLPIGFVANSKNAPRVDFKAVVAGKERTWKGKLKRIDASFEQDSRLLYVTAEVDDPYATENSKMPMAVGLFVTAQIYGQNIKQALVIPRSALRAADKIYVVNDEQRLEMRTVQVKYKSPEAVVISGDVKFGESVVISPIRNPVQGMEVVTMEKADNNNG